jgi:hypothetical protein
MIEAILLSGLLDWRLGRRAHAVNGCVGGDNLALERKLGNRAGNSWSIRSHEDRIRPSAHAVGR